jgi:hypothetical protein
VGKIVSNDRVLGLLARTMGRQEQAANHFEEAVAFCHKVGAMPELAWSCCDYADLLLQNSSSEDRTKAMSLVDKALAISRELAMRPLMERVLSRREALKAPSALWESSASPLCCPDI